VGGPGAGRVGSGSKCSGILWSLSWMDCVGKRTLQSCVVQPLHHEHYPSATNHGFLMCGDSLP
jgi:hypothetical protein